VKQDLPADPTGVGVLGPCVSLSTGSVMLDLCLASNEHVAIPYSRIHVVKWTTVPDSRKEYLAFQVKGVQVLVTGYSLGEVMHAIVAREVHALNVSAIGSIRQDKTCPAVDEIEVTWTDE
jgi:hypothetical protein